MQLPRRMHSGDSFNCSKERTPTKNLLKKGRATHQRRRLKHCRSEKHALGQFLRPCRRHRRLRIALFQLRPGSSFSVSWLDSPILQSCGQLGSALRRLYLGCSGTPVPERKQVRYRCVAMKTIPNSLCSFPQRRYYADFCPRP